MKTPLQAMLWELWRTSRLELLWVLSGQCVFVLLMVSLSAATQIDEAEAAAPVLAGIFVMLATCTSSFSQSWRHSFESGVPGFSFRLGFTRPVSTLQLVVVPMVYIALMGPICYLISAFLFQSLMGIPVPMLFPAMLSACVVCGLAAAAWTPTTNLGKAIGVTIFAFALIGALALFHTTRQHPDPLLMAMGKLDYYRIAWYEYFVIMLLPLLATAFTVVGVERQRHGDLWRLEGFLSWQSSRRVTTKARKPVAAQLPFRSKLAAQSWYEMRKFGFRMLALGAVLPLLPLAFLGFAMIANPDGNMEPAFWLAAILFFPLASQMVGADAALGIRKRQGALHFPPFDATRALRNDQLIAIKLGLIAACSLAGWLWLWAVALAQGWLSGDWPLWVELFDRIAGAAELTASEVPFYWWISAAFSFAFLYVTSTSIMLAGAMWAALHPRLLGCATAWLFSHYLLAIYDFAHGWCFLVLWISYAWIGSAAILFLSVWAIRRALKSGFLGPRFFLIAFVAWAVYLASAGTFLMEIAPVMPACVLALVLASLLIPLATTAMAPLALAAHRNG